LTTCAKTEDGADEAEDDDDERKADPSGGRSERAVTRCAASIVHRVKRNFVRHICFLNSTKPNECDTTERKMSVVNINAFAYVVLAHAQFVVVVRQVKGDVVFVQRKKRKLGYLS